MTQKRFTDRPTERRIDINSITEEEFEMINSAVKTLGLKSRSDYLRLIINLDAATGIIKMLRDQVTNKKDV